MNEKKTIFVVDDDAIFRKVIGRQLEQAGFSVQSFENGQGMAEHMRRSRPVATIIDMVMPDKDGMETLLDLLDTEHRGKVIAVSGTRQYLDYAEGMHIDATLLKPVTPEALMKTLAGLGVVPAQAGERPPS